jgi:hypothetical protein
MRCVGRKGVVSVPVTHIDDVLSNLEYAQKWPVVLVLSNAT